jgi:6-phospho-beta-glucosidase
VRVFNYTNPVNIVAQAWTTHSAIPFVSLCEGPYYFTAELAEAAGLDPAKATSTMVGLNHACWSVEHHYDGADLMPLVVAAAAERLGPDTELDLRQQRILRLAATMGAIPADYFQYYYWRDEVLAEQLASPTTRAEDILSWVPGYWEHYAQQAETDDPVLDPDRSRGGIHELELAIDAMHAVFNDTGDVLPVNVPNTGGVLPGFPEDLVVEITGRCSADWVEPLPQKALPRHVVGLVEMLGEYQALAAEAAWSGTRLDAIRALAANPLVQSVVKAEAIYDELAAAHRALLPDRLLR